MECKICKKQVKNNSGLMSHIRRTHKMEFNNYVSKYYNEDKPIEKCGNCNRDSFFIYRLNDKTNTFTREYKCNYFCNTLECKNDISLKILNTEYNPKTYEHIGSHPKYLSIVKKISIDEATLLTLPNKYNKGEDVKISSRSSLEGYILRYGEIDGPIKYKQRCDKIGRSNTLDWYIDKFGYDIGKQKYNSYILKLRKATTGTKVSKSSQKIKNILDNYNIKYEEEYPIHVLTKKKPKIVDYYLTDYNICLEFFGDFWHCNPKIYDKDYYHKLKKKYAYEIWNDDTIRNNEIINSTNGPLIILWEKNIPNGNILLECVKQTKNKNIIYL